MWNLLTIIIMPGVNEKTYYRITNYIVILMKRKNQKKSADALRPVQLFERGVDFLIESFLYYTVINAAHK